MQYVRVHLEVALSSPRKMDLRDLERISKFSGEEDENKKMYQPEAHFSFDGKSRMNRLVKITDRECSN